MAILQIWVGKGVVFLVETPVPDGPKSKSPARVHNGWLRAGAVLRNLGSRGAVAIRSMTDSQGGREWPRHGRASCGARADPDWAPFEPLTVVRNPIRILLDEYEASRRRSRRRRSWRRKGRHAPTHVLLAHAHC